LEKGRKRGSVKNRRRCPGSGLRRKEGKVREDRKVGRGVKEHFIVGSERQPMGGENGVARGKKNEEKVGYFFWGLRLRDTTGKINGEGGRRSGLIKQLLEKRRTRIDIREGVNSGKERGNSGRKRG